MNVDIASSSLVSQPIENQKMIIILGLMSFVSLVIMIIWIIFRDLKDYCDEIVQLGCLVIPSIWAITCVFKWVVNRRKCSEASSSKK